MIVRRKYTMGSLSSGGNRKNCSALNKGENALIMVSHSLLFIAVPKTSSGAAFLFIRKCYDEGVFYVTSAFGGLRRCECRSSEYHPTSIFSSKPACRRDREGRKKHHHVS